MARPAFQFYPKDFLSDGNQAAMSLQEAGAYIRLLCICWNDGSLLADVGRLARACGATPGQMSKMWPALKPCFREHPDDPTRLIHPRLERERQKQDAFLRRQEANGRKGGRPKAKLNPEETHALTQTEPNTKPKKSSSSPICDLRSADLTDTQSARVNGTAVAEEAEDLNALRAGRFVERYGDLFREYRHGARYVSRPTLDFQVACDLVAVWDDSRLETLAIAFLSTDDKFCREGPGTIGHFRSRASWCDSKLREQGL